MGDEKRHVDHLEEAAHKAEADLRDDLEKAVEFEKADVAETHREWHDQLHNDHAELVADVARDKEEIREALDDARHPERIVHAAEEKLAHAADEARDVVRAVEHPSVIVDETLFVHAAELAARHRQARDVVRAVEPRKHALDETAAIICRITSPADKKRLPVVLRVFGVLLIIGSGVALPVIAKTIYQAVTISSTLGLCAEGISAHRGDLRESGRAGGPRRHSHCVRRAPHPQPAALAALLLLRAVRASSDRGSCSIMLAGVATSLFRRRFHGHGGACSYLDPRCSKNAAPIARPRGRGSMRREAGTLGRDPPGKGLHHAELLQPVLGFVVASVLGLLMEEIVHFLFVVPGRRRDRAGLLFGPFSPICQLRRGAYDHLPQPLPQKAIGSSSFWWRLRSSAVPSRRSWVCSCSAPRSARWPGITPICRIAVRRLPHVPAVRLPCWGCSAWYG